MLCVYMLCCPLQKDGKYEKIYKNAHHTQMFRKRNKKEFKLHRKYLLLLDTETMCPQLASGNAPQHKMILCQGRGPSPLTCSCSVRQCNSQDHSGSCCRWCYCCCSWGFYFIVLFSVLLFLLLLTACCFPSPPSSLPCLERLLLSVLFVAALVLRHTRLGVPHISW